MREAVLWILLLAAGICDSRSRKIPNRLIWTGWSFSILCRFVLEGWQGALFGVMAAALVVSVGMPLYCLRAVGAGDIKLLSVIGAAHGLSFFRQVLIVWMVLSGAVSLWTLVRRRLLAPRFSYLLGYLTTGGYGGKAYYDAGRDGTGCTIVLAPIVVLAYSLVLAGRWWEIC